MVDWRDFKGRDPAYIPGTKEWRRRIEDELEKGKASVPRPSDSPWETITRFLSGVDLGVSKEEASQAAGQILSEMCANGNCSRSLCLRSNCKYLLDCGFGTAYCAKHGKAIVC